MPIANVNLMGPNPGQPFDIQTQQAQLARAQAIAQALIAQGLTPESPVIHTGGGNPFARDVANWSGPLSKALLAITGTMRQGDLNNQEQGLAQEYNSRVKSGIEDFLTTQSPHMEETAGPPVPGEGLPEMAVPGNSMKALANAYGSGLSPVQDLAKALLGANVAIASKSPTRAEIISQLIGHKADPAYLNEAVTNVPTGPFGFALPSVDPTKVRMQTQTVEGRPGGSTLTVNPSEAPLPGQGAGRIVQSSVNPIPQSGPVSPIGAPENPTPNLPYQAAPGGKQEAVPGAEHDPVVIALKTQQKEVQNEIDKKLPEVMAFQRQGPRLAMIAETIHRANIGGLGAVKQFLKEKAVALGLSDDQIGSINSTQTLQALLVPLATEMAKEINSTRATQQEFFRMTEAVGGGANIDPRHTIDMLGQALADGMSNAAQYDNQVLKRAKEVGIPNIESYRAGISFVVPKGVPIDIQPAGIDSFVNKSITTPRGYSEATGAPKVTDTLYEKYKLKKE